jgi:hypothetical protein
MVDHLPTWIPSTIRELEDGHEVGFLYIVIEDFLHLLSTNRKCTQPCYFPLLLKPIAQKEKMDLNSSTKSSRLRVTPVAIPMELWIILLFYFTESHHSV